MRLSEQWLAAGFSAKSPSTGPPCLYLTTSPSPGIPSSSVASCGGSSPSSASCHEQGSVPHRLSVKNSCRRAEGINRLLPFPFFPTPLSTQDHWLHQQVPPTHVSHLFSKACSSLSLLPRSPECILNSPLLLAISHLLMCLFSPLN